MLTAGLLLRQNAKIDYLVFYLKKSCYANIKKDKH